MEPVYVKEALSFINRVHHFAIQNERDGSLQHAVEGTINRHYYSLKETNINFNFFSSLSVFYNLFMLYWSSRVKSILILNIPYFVTLFSENVYIF